MSKSQKKNSKSSKSKSGASDPKQLPDTKSIQLVAGALIYDGIQKEELLSIDIKNPPVLDPNTLVIESKAQVDAYLILWSEWAATFSFAKLKKKNLALLGRSFVELSERFDKPVFVHLISNDLPSTGRLKGGVDGNFHLANFLASQWTSSSSRDSNSDWASLWSQIEKATKLESERFDTFVEHCKIEFNYSLPYDDNPAEPGSEKEKVERLVKNLYREQSDSEVEVKYLVSELQEFLERDPESNTDTLEESDSPGDVSQPEVDSKKSPEEKQDSDKDSKGDEEKESKEDTDSSKPLSTEEEESEFWTANTAVKYIDTKLDSSEEVSEDSEELEDLEHLNKSYDSKQNEIEYVVSESTDGEGDLDPLDFAPDPKSVKDVRDKKVTHELSSKNFLKIAQLKQKQEGVDKDDLKAISDAFDWYFSNANELFENEQYEEAEQDYRNALEKLVQLDKPKAEDEKKLLENLGEVYISLERPDLAVELYESLEEMRIKSSAPIPKYLNALLLEGGNYEKRGYLKDAEPLYRKAVEIAGNYLELNDPLLKRANEACLRLTKEKTNLISRFTPGELERLKSDDESEKAIMHRKPVIKNKEQVDTQAQDIWFKKEEQSPPVASKAYSPVKWWLIALIPLAALSFATVFYFKNLKTPISATVEDSIEFSTCDKKMSIALEHSGLMTLTSAKGKIEGTYRFIDESMSDYVALLVGHLRRKNQFLEVKSDDLVSLDGMDFYSKDSPENKIVKYMWRYSKLAQLYRNEHKKYPDDTRFFSKNSRITSTYVNPFSSKREVAEIVYATGSNNINLPRMISKNHMWKGQPAGRPGLIVCNNFEGSRFFIRGYDREGKLIPSATPGSGFFIELSYGDNLTRDQLKKAKLNSKLETTRQNIRYIFVRGSTEIEKIFPLLDALVPTILVVLAIIPFLLWRYKKKKALSTKKEVFAFVAALTAIALWYLIAFMDT